MFASYELKQLGGNVKVTGYPENDLQGQATSIGYFDRSQIKFIYNPLSNTVTATIAGDKEFTTPDVTGGQVLFIKTTLGGDVDIINESLFDTNYALLFPKLGGGSGTTPNLQEVCVVGNITDTDILLQADINATAKEIGIANTPNDGKGIRMRANNSNDSGWLEFINKDGTSKNIMNEIGGEDFFQLPDKGGVFDTFAMLSDLASAANNWEQVMTNGNETTKDVLLRFIKEVNKLSIADSEDANFEYIKMQLAGAPGDLVDAIIQIFSTDKVNATDINGDNVRTKFFIAQNRAAGFVNLIRSVATGDRDNTLPDADGQLQTQNTVTLDMACNNNNQTGHNIETLANLIGAVLIIKNTTSLFSAVIISDLLTADRAYQTPDRDGIIQLENEFETGGIDISGAPFTPTQPGIFDVTTSALSGSVFDLGASALPACTSVTILNTSANAFDIDTGAGLISIAVNNCFLFKKFNAAGWKQITS